MAENHEVQAYGRLGVHQSRLTNVTMLGKLVWDLINVVDKLWVRLLITTYSTNVAFMRAPVRRSLALWNALIKTRAHLHEGFTWRVGEGNISFLYAHYAGSGPLCLSVPYVHVSILL